MQARLLAAVWGWWAASSRQGFQKVPTEPGVLHAPHCLRPHLTSRSQLELPSVPVEVLVELTAGPSSGGRGLKFPSRVNRNKLLCDLSHVRLLTSGSEAIADSKN